MKSFRAGSILDINETFVIYFQKRIVNFKPMDITEYATPRQVLHSVNFVKQTYLGDSHFPAKLEEKCKKNICLLRTSYKSDSLVHEPFLISVPWSLPYPMLSSDEMFTRITKFIKQQHGFCFG